MNCAKRLISLNLMLVFLVTLMVNGMAIGASAVDDIPIVTINGTSYYASDFPTDNMISGGGWRFTYNPGLSSGSIALDGYSGGPILSSLDYLNVTYMSENSITANASTSGIESAGQLAIIGQDSAGSLIVTGSDGKAAAKAVSEISIWTSNSDLVLYGGSNAPAVFSGDKLRIDGANLTAVGGNTSAFVYSNSFSKSNYYNLFAGENEDNAVKVTDYNGEYYIHTANTIYIKLITGTGGTFTDGSTTKYYAINGKFTFPYLTVPPGSMFVGWRQDKAGGHWYRAGEQADFSANVAYIAQYADDLDYPGIVLDGNGGYQANGDSFLTNIGSTNLAEYKNAFTRIGYTLTSWNTSADGSGTSYDLDESNTVIESGSVTTLYAQWEYKNKLIIDGAEYSATQNQSGQGWDYYYYGSSSLQRLNLNGYHGGAIYLPCSAYVGYIGKNTITASDSIGLEVLGNCSIYSISGRLNVTGGNHFPAVSATGSLNIDTSFTAIGGACAALEFDTLKIGNISTCNVLVGTDAETAVSGIYQGQQYINVEEILYQLTLNGNGGLTETSTESKTIVSTSSSSGDLYLYHNTFTKENEVLLGWTDNPDGSGDYYSTEDVYNFDTSENEADLYALWTNETRKAVTLIDYSDANTSNNRLRITWNRVLPCTKNETIILPAASKSACKFEGWLDEDGVTLYPPGTILTITDNISLTARYSPLELIIDGNKYDASINQKGLGWEYYNFGKGNTQINLYSNYSGKQIVVPADVLIEMCETPIICGEIGQPAIEADGNIELDCCLEVDTQIAKDITINGGYGAPALAANGYISINSLNVRNLNIIGGFGAPAISSTGKVYIKSTEFLAGANESSLKTVDIYTNENYVRIDEFDCITLCYGDIIPDAPISDTKSFIGWTTEKTGWGSSNKWYMPGDTMNSKGITELYAQYIDNNLSTVAVVLAGNGGETSNGSGYSVIYTSSSDLHMYLPDGNIFSKSDDSMTGWNTYPNGSGTSYSYGEYITVPGVDRKFTVYAQWQSNSSGEGLIEGVCGSNLIWTLDTHTGVLSITGSGFMIDISGENTWNSYRSNIRSVDIGIGVMSIGNFAFCGCTNLLSVNIPNSITSIGDSAFKYCSGLTSVSIPSSVTSIRDSAFKYCSGLTSVSIPSSVTSIRNSAFKYCSGLTSVSIPSSVTSIGDFSFDSCSGLTSISIPSSVTSIGYYSFRYCSGLTSISIPDSVTSIGRNAFYSCSPNLTIYGKSGSNAEFYAKNYNIKFEPENAAPGDVNGDGEIDQLDVALLRRYLAGWANITISEDAADVNDDGAIDQIDVALLRRYLAGWSGVVLK